MLIHQQNEGKSWLQWYVQSTYGFARTVGLDLKGKANNIYLALSKRPLTTTDIFMFNDGRASSEDAKPCYSVVEDIKDGTAINGKYQCEVVFSRRRTLLLYFQMLTRM